MGGRRVEFHSFFVRVTEDVSLIRVSHPLTRRAGEEISAIIQQATRSSPLPRRRSRGLTYLIIIHRSQIGMQTLTINAVRAVGPPSTRQCQPSKNASLVACRAGKADGYVEFLIDGRTIMKMRANGAPDRVGSSLLPTGLGR